MNNAQIIIEAIKRWANHPSNIFETGEVNWNFVSSDLHIHRDTRDLMKDISPETEEFLMECAIADMEAA